MASILQSSLNAEHIHPFLSSFRPSLPSFIHSTSNAEIQGRVGPCSHYAWSENCHIRSYKHALYFFREVISLHVDVFKQRKWPGHSEHEMKGFVQSSGLMTPAMFNGMKALPHRITQESKRSAFFVLLMCWEGRCRSPWSCWWLHTSKQQRKSLGGLFPTSLDNQNSCISYSMAFIVLRVRRKGYTKHIVNHKIWKQGLEE